MKQGLVFLSCAILLLSGCKSAKYVPYFTDMDNGMTTMKVDEGYEITIKPADFLSIVVNTESMADAELASSFNGPMSDAGMGIVNSNSLNYDRDRRGYLVGNDGCINFPILGKLWVQGMTRAQLIAFIEQRIKEEGYIANPIVTASIVNLKISVLGEVARPGQYTVSSDRITLLDALSLAGDMTIYGNRKRVLVIREDGGERTVTTLDLSSKQIFNSPYFYVRQNDVVYVEPNKQRSQQANISPMWSTGLSTGSLLVSIATLIVTLTK